MFRSVKHISTSRIGVAAFRFLAAAVLMGVLIPQVSAEPQGTDQPSKTFIVGVEAIRHLPYYGMCDGTYCGFARDLLDAFAADHGIRVEYRPMPIPRLHRSLINGTVDAKFPAHPTWAPDEKGTAPVIYSDPVISFTDGYMSPPGMSGHPQSVGTIRGFTLDLRGIETKPRLFQANTEADLYNLLIRGRIDAAYTNIGVMRFFLADQNISQESVVFRRDLPFRISKYYLSTTTRPTIIGQFNEWLTKNGEALVALQARHGITTEQSHPSR